MNLKSLPKQELLSQIEKLVSDERRITSNILWHLHEIDRRKLFAELGFASLFEYCTKHLKYSDGSAHRRISAMRLLREIPEIESKINSGILNVSALSQAQSMFRQAKLENKIFGADEKKELLFRLEGKSHRECEKILSDISPALRRPSQERVITPARTEICFEADDVLYEKLKLLKARFAHKLKGSNDYKDLIVLLADCALEKSDSKQAKPKNAANKIPALPALEVKTICSTSSRYIPVKIKRVAWSKAGGRCSYVSPETGLRCNSQYALEYDHQIPLARGGKTELQNIRLLCRNHNQFVAIQKLGLRKMEQYFAR